MLLNIRKLVLGFALSLFLLPMVAFASSEFKGTETVNINKANAATLAAYLKGIGPNKAEAIIKFRKLNGSFKTAADIKNVPGVGDETYKDIKSKISTSRGKSLPPKGYKLGNTSGKSKSVKKLSSKKTSTKKLDKSKVKTTSTKAKKSTATKKASSKTKKAATTKKASSAKKKASTTKKKATSKKKSTTKKASTKKKPVKKKKTTKK